MNIFFSKFSVVFLVVCGVMLLVCGLFMTPFAKNVYAQAQPQITVHVPPRIPDPNFTYILFPDHFVPDPIAYTKKNMINEAAAISPAKGAQMEAALKPEGFIKVKADTQDVIDARGDTSYLEYPPGKVYKLKNGEEARKQAGIKQGLKEIDDAKKSIKPQEHQAILVGTKYFVETAAQSPEYCNRTAILKVIGTDPVVEKGSTIISDGDGGKQCELATNVSKGTIAVKLGEVMVGPGLYTVGTCAKNSGSGSPSHVKPTSNAENSFVACNPAEADPAAASNSGFGGPEGPGGNPGGAGSPGGPGGLGGLASMLPLLMQMLGQGGQGQGQNPYGNQNPYGAGYGNQQQLCAQQPISPVCGIDGQTYKNECYRQQTGVSARHNGVCAQASSSPTPQPTPDIAKLMNQLATSGVPATLVEALKNIVAQILASVPSGTPITETVVR